MQHKPISLLFAAVVALLICGCPAQVPPPFDTTGAYVGTWSGQTNEGQGQKQQEVAACPLTITLEQDVNTTYPANHGVKGTVVIDYSCVELPEWVTTEIPPSTVQVGGLLADDGKLTLMSGGCGTGLCLVLVLAGQGVDGDADGVMDTYSGSWSFVILLAGVQPFGVSGLFEVERQAES